MTRITKKQIETILRLFLSGTSVNNLASSYEVDVKKIEDLIRVALRAREAVK